MRWVWEYFTYRWKEIKQQKEVRERYYAKNALFSQVDRALLNAYFLQNPYGLSRRFEEKKGRHATPPPYGETPLKTFEKIGERIGLRAEDRVLELGCGRGRGAFFLHSFFQCRVLGVEWVPHFVEVANRIAKAFWIEGVSFRCFDMLALEEWDADYIYLFGTCLEEWEILTLIDKLKRCKKGVGIATVSYPLSDYAPEGVFALRESFSAPFLWGETDVYLQIVE